MNPFNFDIDEELESMFPPKKEEPPRPPIPEPGSRLVDRFQVYRKQNPGNFPHDYVNVQQFIDMENEEIAKAEALSAEQEKPLQIEPEMSAADKFLAGLTPPTIIPEAVYAEIKQTEDDETEESIFDLHRDPSDNYIQGNENDVVENYLNKSVDYSLMPLGQRESQEMNGVKDHGLGLFKERSAEQSSFHHDMMEIAQYYNVGTKEESQPEIKYVNPEEVHALPKLESTPFGVIERLTVEEAKERFGTTPFEPTEENTTGQPDLFAMEEKEPLTLNQSLAQKKEENITIPPATKVDPAVLVKAFEETGYIFVDANNTGKQSIKMTVLGEPSAQKRHRHAQPKGMKFVMTYDPSAADKKDFLSIIQSHAPAVPFDCPLKMEMNLFFSRPKSHFNSKGEVKESAPTWKASGKDLDNCTKYAQDAMNKVFYRDDTLICVLHVTKKYDLNPRTEIILTVL